VSDIKAKTEALKQASYKIAEELYKQNAGNAGAAGAGAQGAPGGFAGGAPGEAQDSGSPGEKPAEDADYEVVDGDKK
ncbi:MAG: molecular chaperone DnaK, partial [Spirochaetaceae bacterium]|jgi:molecular chaperone DnaK|nr:molecular chaperone DnaK [Spirochaetaceae bacterium]